MIALLQRVSQASVHVDGELIGAIGRGLLVLVCAEHGDSDAVADKLLVVSQFTLAADVSGGNRPSFTGAAPPAEGKRLYEYFLQRTKIEHPQVQSGRFGADMQVALVNDGPVTLSVTVRSPA
jgi:D-tyrosyl-tRNA(Tyr) deacylase